MANRQEPIIFARELRLSASLIRRQNQPAFKMFVLMVYLGVIFIFTILQSLRSNTQFGRKFALSDCSRHMEFSNRASSVGQRADGELLGDNSYGTFE